MVANLLPKGWEYQKCFSEWYALYHNDKLIFQFKQNQKYDTTVLLNSLIGVLLAVKYEELADPSELASCIWKHWWVHQPSTGKIFNQNHHDVISWNPVLGSYQLNSKSLNTTDIKTAIIKASQLLDKQELDATKNQEAAIKEVAHINNPGGTAAAAREKQEVIEAHKPSSIVTHKQKEINIDTDIAVKADAGKPAIHFISPIFIEELGKALEYGERKYSGRNWEKGLAWSRPFASCQRHLWAWWRGIDIDEESGLSHLALATANIMMLVHYMNLERYADFDDRSKM